MRIGGGYFCTQCQRYGCACASADGIATIGTCGCTALGPCDAHRLPTYRACLHDVPEGDPCARCDGMRLADVPEPKVPPRPRAPALAPADAEPLYLDVPPPVAPALSGRRVLRPEQHEPGFVTLHDRAFERVALVSPEAARRLAVIDSALAEDAGMADGIRNDAAFARRRAEDFEERARVATGEADRARRTELEGLARNARRWEALYLAVLGADSDVAHAPKVQPPEPSRETP